MALVNLGSMQLDAALVGNAEVNIALGVVNGIAVPNLSAQITALASFSPSLTVDFTAQLALIDTMIANIEAALAAIPPIPTLTLDAQVALALSVKVALQAVLDLVQLKVDLQAEIAGFLATAGVRVYAWDGANNALGPALTTALGGAATHSNAVILYTTSGTTWTAMQALLKTS